MTHATQSELSARRLTVGIGLAALSLSLVWLGFHLGTLAQRVRRANQLLGVEKIKLSAAGDAQLALEGMLDTSAAIVRAELCLFAAAVVALLLVGVLDWATPRTKVAAVLIVLVSWVLLLLTTSIV